MLKASGLGLFSSTRLDGSKDIQSVKSGWSIFIQEFKAHIPPQSSWGEYKQRKTNTQCSQQLNKNSIANKFEMEKNIRTFGSILPQPYPQPQTLLCRGIEKLVILNRLLIGRWTLSHHKMLSQKSLSQFWQTNMNFQKTSQSLVKQPFFQYQVKKY